MSDRARETQRGAVAATAEVILQWAILRDIGGARTGITIPKRAASRRVQQRTVWRDIDALCSAGFRSTTTRRWIHGVETEDNAVPWTQEDGARRRLFDR